MACLPDMVRDIHHIFDTTPGVNCFPSRRQSCINEGFHTWSQCDNGLLLQYSYGIPSQIITPYGNLRIICDVSTNNIESYQIIHKRMSELLSLTLYKQSIDNNIYGSRGPWYRITNYRNITIPSSNLIYPVTIKYEVAKSKFNSIFI